MNREVNTISARLSLRSPQRQSLEILADVLEQVNLSETETAQALEIIQTAYPSVTDFERDFPSLCFALATGVGKTRLMGAFISYLYLTNRSRHFFVLAPNKTIYEKLIGDFSPESPKYVFRGITEFAITRPIIITGDNYDSGLATRIDPAAQQRTQQVLSLGDQCFINIFNVDKINKAENKPGAAKSNTPRIKRLQEYIGESYFDYLAGLPDLVLLMDEAHRYRGSAGAKAISELKAILGLELTATPKTTGAKPEPFKNVIYSYTLSEALNDRDPCVKEPAVATRENFKPADYNQEELEQIKLEDGIHHHEHVKIELDIYARQNDKPLVHPFMLVVAQDTTHASALKAMIESNAFFEGRYKGKVIEVHSNLRGEESDENMERLVKVEHDPNTEIVIHVNKLKEGWDVTNLYTIVPLRTSASEILTEQTIGRGLRLPYGKRTGVEAVDRLTVIAHERFQEVIDRAKDADSIIRKAIIIGENGDVPLGKPKLLEVPSLLETMLTGDEATPGQEAIEVDGKKSPSKSIFDTPEKRKTASVTLEVIRRYEKLKGIEELKKPEIQAQIAKEVEEALAPAQQTIEGVIEKPDILSVVEAVTQTVVEQTIEIPEIVLLPTEQVTFGFHEFDLKNLDTIRPQPVSDNIVMHNLVSDTRSTLRRGGPAVREDRLEDYLVSHLVEHDEIDYDDNADLLYKLTGEMVGHIRAYLPKAADVENVVLNHQRQLADFIYAQMLENLWESPTDYEVKVSRGFTLLRPNAFNLQDGEEPRSFREPVRNKSDIRRMVFTGFQRCCYPLQKFDSDSERQFAVILDDDTTVMRWMKPASGQFRIEWKNGQPYWPDFVVETDTEKLICEVKARNELKDQDVQLKAEAAIRWCEHASEAGREAGKKPWRYLLLPDDDLASNRTLQGLASAYSQLSRNENVVKAN